MFRMTRYVQNDTYGLVMKEDGGNVFAYYSDIEGEDLKRLSEGDRVKFEIFQNSKGSKAINVVKL